MVCNVILVDHGGGPEHIYIYIYLWSSWLKVVAYIMVLRLSFFGGGPIVLRCFVSIAKAFRPLLTKVVVAYFDGTSCVFANKPTSPLHINRVDEAMMQPSCCKAKQFLFEAELYYNVNVFQRNSRHVHIQLL